MTYKIGEETIKNRKVRTFIMYGMTSCFLIFIFSLFVLRLPSGNGQGKVLLFSLFFTIITSGLITYFAARSMIRRSQIMKLNLEKDHLEIAGTDGNQIVPYASITLLSVVHNPDSLFIRVGKKRYGLGGFENMKEIQQIVREKVSPSLVEEETRRLNFDNPLMVILLSILGLGLFVLTLLIVNAIGLGSVFEPLANIVIGISFSVYFSKNTPKYMMKLGWVLIVIGIIQLLMKYFVEGK